jgi:hypothetical protein
MKLTLATILESELGSWFGVHEAGRSALPAGGYTIRLDPGGYQDAIEIAVQADITGQLTNVVLLLDRAIIEVPATAPFAADFVKSALPVLAPDNAATGDLAQRLAQQMFGTNLLVHVSALPEPRPAPAPEIGAALDVYRGTAQRVELSGVDSLVRFENVAGSSARRLHVIITPALAEGIVQSGVATQGARTTSSDNLDCLQLFMQERDLPAGMSMPEDWRSLGAFPERSSAGWTHSASSD